LEILILRSFFVSWERAPLYVIVAATGRKIIREGPKCCCLAINESAPTIVEGWQRLFIASYPAILSTAISFASFCLSKYVFSIQSVSQYGSS